VRFGFWGAEEGGIAGSQYYARTLSEEDADRLKFYFNFDMIGSPSPYFHVYADTDGHRVGGQFLYDYLVSQGIEPEWVNFEDNSDYIGFLNIGVQASGLFTGAEPDTDPCYHLACDTIDNINWEAITVNARAAASAVAELALSVEGIPPREEVNVNPSSKRGVARDLARWASLAAHAESSHSCGGHAKNVV
jgi:aminopeptidase Y